MYLVQKQWVYKKISYTEFETINRFTYVYSYANIFYSTANKHEVTQMVWYGNGNLLRDGRE